MSGGNTWGTRQRLYWACACTFSISATVRAPALLPALPGLAAASCLRAMCLATRSTRHDHLSCSAYEKDLRRPAIAFGMNLGITAIIALAVVRLAGQLPCCEDLLGEMMLLYCVTMSCQAR